MANNDRTDDQAPEQPHPIDPPVSEEERYRLNAERKEQGGVRDVGRTSGGGSLGHVQPERVEREGPLRNNAETRDDDEPTLPSKDSSLKTKL